MKRLSLLLLIFLICYSPFISLQGSSRQMASALNAGPSSIISSSYTIEEYIIPAPSFRPEYIDQDSSGRVWFDEVDTSELGTFYRMTNSFSEYPTSDSITIPSRYSRNLQVDLNDSIWFTALYPNKIIRYDPANNVSTEYAVPTVNGSPYGITVDLNGNVWFTEIFGNKIGRISPNGDVTEYAVPTPFAGPSGISASPDGSVWFTEDGLSLPLSDVQKIGKLDPETGNITEYLTPSAKLSAQANLVDIVCDSEGNAWFTEASNNKIGEFSVGSAQFTEYDLPTLDGYPWGIDVDENSNVWFTESNGNKIGRLSWNKAFKEYPVPTVSGTPVGIVCTNGAVWFTEEYGNKIGRLEVIKHGDLNYDGIINIFDAIVAARAFGSSPGNIRWNSEADLDDNNAIDIFDLILLASNCGKRFS